MMLLWLFNSIIVGNLPFPSLPNENILIWMKSTSLKIKIISCRNLAAKDKNGFSDPYCQIRLGKRLKQSTKVIPKTLSPAWHAEFIFPVASTLIESSLMVTVWVGVN